MSDIFIMSDLYKEISLIGEEADSIDPKFLRDEIYDSIMDQFETDGEGRWEPLSPSTLKRKKNPAAGILVDTGAMRRSIFGEYSSDEVVIYVGVPYAKYHQTGTKHMPQRDFSDINLAEIIEFATNRIMQDITG